MRFVALLVLRGRTQIYQYLWLQHELSSSLPALNVLSGASNIAERINFVDLDIDSVLLDELPQLS